MKWTAVFFAIAACFCNAMGAEPAKPGITGITGGSATLVKVPTAPAGQTWFYGTAMPLQLDETTGGLLANLRRNGTPYNDYEAGADMIVFRKLEEISPKDAVPVARPTTEKDPVTGVLSSLSVYPMYAGFVPRGAALDDGSAHPHNGTGFGVYMVGFYPADISRPFPKPVQYRLEIVQFRFADGKFTVGKPTRMPAAGMPVGKADWDINSPGFSSGVADGRDLLFAARCRNRANNRHLNGVVRFRYGENAWQPVGFMPVTAPGSESTMIRDVDGSLLFTSRISADIPLWRSTDGGATWNQLFVKVKSKRPETPSILNRAADGTPYFTVNANDSTKRRNTLQLVAVNSDRSGLDAPITILNGMAAFGQLPSNDNWGVDHGYGNVIRLADGKLHAILVHRIMTRVEHFNASLGSPHTGLYVKEVLSTGEPRPIWKFVSETAKNTSY